MSLKIDQVLRRYSGEEDDYGRFDEWLSKFELVSTVQGWDDAKQLELLPLFFERTPPSSCPLVLAQQFVDGLPDQIMLLLGLGYCCMLRRKRIPLIWLLALDTREGLLLLLLRVAELLLSHTREVMWLMRFCPPTMLKLRRIDNPNRTLSRGYVVDEVLSPTMLKLRRIDNPNRTLSVHVSSVLPVKGSVVDADSRAVQPSVPLTGSHAVRPARSVGNDDIEVELDFGGVANGEPQSERDIFDDALSASSALYSDITDHSIDAVEPVVAPARVYGDADAPHVLRPRSALRAPSRLDL
ncbi:hypothetical protein FOZ63_020803 [Perkinsus olseni]|uniref:Uncharacterized protein n=1 Tax=Perkinsus olseni TaxID=32597 RepID=A0A7J6QUQ1_PEROL|nr:hypothetical protein FOZ63_020803 [Perkinsus olseni]